MIEYNRYVVGDDDGNDHSIFFIEYISNMTYTDTDFEWTETTRGQM